MQSSIHWSGVRWWNFEVSHDFVSGNYYSLLFSSKLFIVLIETNRLVYVATTLTTTVRSDSITVNEASSRWTS